MSLFRRETEVQHEVPHEVQQVKVPGDGVSCVLYQAAFFVDKNGDYTEDRADMVCVAIGTFKRKRAYFTDPRFAFEVYPDATVTRVQAAKIGPEHFITANHVEVEK